jgi:nucleoside-diphosphate-sugar epimerase
MKNILIIGGSGVVGSALIKKLSSQTYKIISVDKNENQNLKIKSKNVFHHKIDLTKKKNLEILRNYISSADIIFFKIAILGNPNFSTNHQYAHEYIKVNTLILLSIIKMVINSNVTKLIVDSSISAISSVNKGNKMQEDKENNFPMNFYGLSKSLLEDILYIYFKNSTKSVYILRYPRIFSINIKSVLYYFVEGIVKNRTVTIIGNANKIIDLVHLDDVIDFSQKLINSKSTSGIHFCHISSEEAISLTNLISKIKKTLNISGIIKTIYNNEIKVVNEPLRNSLSMKKTKENFNYKPKIKINDMIVEVYKKITN